MFKFYIKLLKKKMGKVGSEAEKVALTEQTEHFIVLVINSCDYCMEMIP